MRPLWEGEAWKLTKEIDLGGEKRVRNYLATGKVEIEGYFEILYYYLKKSMIEERDLKIAFTKIERKQGAMC